MNKAAIINLILLVVIVAAKMFIKDQTTLAIIIGIALVIGYISYYAGVVQKRKAQIQRRKDQNR